MNLQNRIEREISYRTVEELGEMGIYKIELKVLTPTMAASQSLGTNLQNRIESSQNCIHLHGPDTANLQNRIERPLFLRHS